MPTTGVDPLARELDAAVRRPRSHDEAASDDAPEHPRRPILFLVVVAITHRHHLLGQPADQGRGRLLRRRPRRSPASRTGWRSAATTCRAASFLGISGAIALSGYDGFLYSIGFLVAWLVALLLVAELLRNSGRYTMADQLAYRMRQTPGAHRGRDRRPSWCRSSTCSPRWSARAHSSRCCSASSGRAVEEPGRSSASALLMIFYVTVGGMKGTTWVQIVKAVLLMTGTIADHGPGAGASSTSTSPTCWARRPSKTGKGDAFLEPGPEVRHQDTDQQDRLPVASASPSCWAPPGCRTS